MIFKKDTCSWKSSVQSFLWWFSWAMFVFRGWDREDLPNMMASNLSLHGLGTLLGRKEMAGRVVRAGEVTVTVVVILLLPAWKNRGYGSSW